MYDKLDKSILIEMLIEANNQLSQLSPVVNQFNDKNKKHIKFLLEQLDDLYKGIDIELEKINKNNMSNAYKEHALQTHFLKIKMIAFALYYLDENESHRQTKKKNDVHYKIFGRYL